MISPYFLGNGLSSWFWATGSFILLFIITLITRNLLIRWFKPSEESLAQDGFTVKKMIHTFLRHISRLFLFIFALYTGSQFLILPLSMVDFINVLVRIALFYQLGLLGNATINLLLIHAPNKAQDNALDTIMIGFSLLGKIILWTILLLLSLQNIGIHITTLLASLGVGGIAVGLALQRVMGDIISSLAIVLDKPFVPGDFIVLDTFSGTVERIGLKTTRIHSITGEELIISNTDLIQGRIHNFSKLIERRIVMSFGVTYDTPIDVLEQIPSMVKEIIEQVADTRFDRAHFKILGPYSLNYEVVFYMTTSDYLTFMNAQQTINLALMRKFETEQIEFAFPTQTLLVENPTKP
nr:mechanosensitive ion channel family protein [Bacilli bacterium]